MKNSVKFDAVRVNSTPEVLVDQIMKQIKSGKLKPGEVLPSQRELARMFGVGLGSIRKAIKILDVMGYLNIIRGKGTIVSKDALSIQKLIPTIENALDAVSITELMKAREVVESGAARSATRMADKESIKQLRDITARMVSADLHGESYYENDFRFHIEVAESSENPAISEIVKLLIDKAHQHIIFMNNSLGICLTSVMDKCIGRAVKVVDCIEVWDVERAGEAMVEHLNTVNGSLLKEFPAER